MARVQIQITDNIDPSLVRKIKEIGSASDDGAKAVDRLKRSFEALSTIDRRFAESQSKNANAFRESIRFIRE